MVVQELEQFLCMEKFSASFEVNKSVTIWYQSSCRSHTRIGMGKPSFFRSLVFLWKKFWNSFTEIYLVVPAAILASFGSFAAKLKTSLSRNGTLTSRECAMLILSAFCKIIARKPVVQIYRLHFFHVLKWASVFWLKLFIKIDLNIPAWKVLLLYFSKSVLSLFHSKYMHFRWSVLLLSFLRG